MKTESLRIYEIANAKEIVKFLNVTSRNCGAAFYFMEDEYTDDPVLRKMDDWEIRERMAYSFSKCPDGWSWKNEYESNTVEEMAQAVLDMIEKKY